MRHKSGQDGLPSSGHTLHKKSYTPGTGGSEDSDRERRHTGMTDGPGSVSAPVLARRGDGCNESVGVDDDDDDVKSEGVAEARAAARRMRTAEGYMDVEPVDLIWENGERAGLSQPGQPKRRIRSGRKSFVNRSAVRLEVRGEAGLQRTPELYGKLGSLRHRSIE